MKPQRLTKAPIQEAIIDLRVSKEPDGLSKEDLATFGEAINVDYPQRNDRQRWTTQLALKAGESQAAQRVAWYGYQFTSADGCTVAQARLDGFAVSRLRPYQSWNDLTSETARLWTAFVHAAQPSRVSRVAVRYINKLCLPLPAENIREYLRTYPEVAEGMPQAMLASFLRVVLPDRATGALAIVAQAAEVTPEPQNPLHIILDIDVVQNCDLEPQASEVWDALERLRELKNAVFFSTFTDKVLERYL